MDFIQILFGTDKREIWQDFSSMSSGEFIDGGFWGTDKLKITYKNWTIIFDTLTKKVGKSRRIHTRSQVVFEKKRDFVFIICPERYFGLLEKITNANTIVTHYDEIDDHFIVKGDQEYILMELLADHSVRKLLHSIHVFSFRTSEYEPVPMDLDQKKFKVLTLESAEENESMQHLQSLLYLNQATLNKLATLDLIYPNKPEIQLL